MEDCSWEEATPTLKNPNRVPDPSTRRHWAPRPSSRISHDKSPTVYQLREVRPVDV